MSSPAPLRRPVLTSALIAAALAVVPAGLPATGGLPGPTAAHAASAKAKKPVVKKPTVEGVLRTLRSSRAISAADQRTWQALYRDAQAKAKLLPKGTSRTELLGVLRNTDQIAARGKLSASLAPSVFLTLQVNRDWWTTQPVPPVGSRPVVPGSPLTWQYYGGEGLQIQWLATFGNANALATTTTPAKLAALRSIEDEALRLESDRSGNPTWQSLFDFGGGAPPWSSGMGQVTAMQSLVRTSAKLGDPKYRDAALRAVSLLRTSSPTGALYRRPGGDHVLLYTFTRMRVGNAFTQAVSGLHEVAATTGDGKVAALYVRAERELRAELPSYDLGNWARYSLGGAPETPSYHLLSRDLLRGLCRALTADAEAFAAGQPVAGARAPASPTLYCATAARYTQDLVDTPNGPAKQARTRAAGATAPTLAARADDYAETPAPDAAATLADPALTRP